MWGKPISSLVRHLWLAAKREHVARHCLAGVEADAPTGCGRRRQVELYPRLIGVEEQAERRLLNACPGRYGRPHEASQRLRRGIPVGRVGPATSKTPTRCSAKHFKTALALAAKPPSLRR